VRGRRTCGHLLLSMQAIAHLLGKAAVEFGRLWTIERNRQGTGETALPFRASDAQPLSYADLRPRPGFEPGLLRTSEVTDLFTTGFRLAQARESHYAEAQLGQGGCSLCMAMRVEASGEQAKPASGTKTQAERLHDPPEPASHRPTQGAVPRYASNQAGVEPALPWCDVTGFFTTRRSAPARLRAGRISFQGNGRTRIAPHGGAARFQRSIRGLHHLESSEFSVKSQSRSSWPGLTRPPSAMRRSADTAFKLGNETTLRRRAWHCVPGWPGQARP
jgi:hypothetical protein